MSEYPAGIYVPRTKENDDGVVYDPDASTKLFAEDVVNLDDEVVAIETDLAQKVLQVKVLDEATALAVGNGKLVFCIPTKLNGMLLKTANAFISTTSSSGDVAVQVRNITKAVDMLSTTIGITATDYSSYESATPGVVDTAHDDVSTGDLIAIDIDGAGTGAKGLGVILTFSNS